MRANTSSGESVPEVMTTLRKRSKTGRMASEASRQQSCSSGSDRLGVRLSNGSIITWKPDSYVVQPFRVQMQQKQYIYHIIYTYISYYIYIKKNAYVNVHTDVGGDAVHNYYYAHAAVRKQMHTRTDARKYGCTYINTPKHTQAHPSTHKHTTDSDMSQQPTKRNEAKRNV